MILLRVSLHLLGRQPQGCQCFPHFALLLGVQAVGYPRDNTLL